MIILLVIIFFYFIAGYFYNLAEHNNRNGYIYGLLSIIAFLLGYFQGAALLSAKTIFENNDSLSIREAIIFEVLCIPFGLLTTSMFYFLLSYLWNKPKS